MNTEIIRIIGQTLMLLTFAISLFYSTLSIINVLKDEMEPTGCVITILLSIMFCLYVTGMVNTLDKNPHAEQKIMYFTDEHGNRYEVKEI